MNERDAIHDGTVYANSDILKTANVSKLLLSGKTLEQLLSEDRREVAKADENNVWYHKKISRESAESILQEGNFHLFSCRCTYTKSDCLRTILHLS